MISLALVTALALAAPSPNASLQPRKNFSACLQKHLKDSLAAKMEAAAFSASLKTVCPAEASAFKNALVASDLATGIKRAAAESNASMDLETYTSNADESYKDQIAAQTPK